MPSIYRHNGVIVAPDSAEGSGDRLEPSDVQKMVPIRDTSSNTQEGRSDPHPETSGRRNRAVESDLFANDRLGRLACSAVKLSGM